MHLIQRAFRLAVSKLSRLVGANGYTQIQRWVYRSGTSDHIEHNANPDYWRNLLGPVKNDPASWSGKSALDFGCGRGRNVANLLEIANWKNVDGIDLSRSNINSCRARFRQSGSRFFVANGTSLYPIQDAYYDFVMSTITLQHIPIFTLRDQILRDIYRVLRQRGTLSLQMGFGGRLDSNSSNGRATYRQDVYSALGTNSEFDVEIGTVHELEKHLAEVGFSQIQSVLTPSWSDVNHRQWIWTTANK